MGRRESENENGRPPSVGGKERESDKENGRPPSVGGRERESEREGGTATLPLAPWEGGRMRVPPSAGGRCSAGGCSPPQSSVATEGAACSSLASRNSFISSNETVVLLIHQYDYCSSLLIDG